MVGWDLGIDQPPFSKVAAVDALNSPRPDGADHCCGFSWGWRCSLDWTIS
jgi:hypothetical protein